MSAGPGSSDPRPSVKILGERSTGTNFLSRIIRENFDVELFPSSSGVKAEQTRALPSAWAGRWSSRRATKEAIQDHNHFVELPVNGGWKHAAATPRLVDEFLKPRQCVAICLVRHPVNWVRSMHRNPFHGVGRVPARFSGFLRSPWIGVGRDELGERWFETPLALYERKLSSYRWLTSVYQYAYVVRYEDVLFDPVRTFAALPIWQFRKSDDVMLPETSARSFGKEPLNLAAYKQKATAASYSELQAADRNFVLQALADGDLLRYYPADGEMA